MQRQIRPLITSLAYELGIRLQNIFGFIYLKKYIPFNHTFFYFFKLQFYFDKNKGNLKKR